MSKYSRRKFIKSASALTAFGGALSVIGCQKPGTDSGTDSVEFPSLNWKLVTTWPPNFPIFGDMLEVFCKWVEEMSSGKFKIQMYAGGELIPPFESFEAVSGGMAEMGHGAAYYWAGKVPAATYFCSVPFGMTAQQTNAWFYNGDGLKLWEEVYSRFNLVPFPGGNTGGQMGGWFKKEINSMDDLKGLKMRIPGLGGQVITKAGGTTVLSPGAEIFTNLERGVIDATEWVGPNHDYNLGLPQVAKYYYYPGWQEPSACCDLFVNKSAYENLPQGYKDIIKTGAMALNLGMLSMFEMKNTEYLDKIKTEFPDVRILKFPDEVISGLKEISKQVISEQIAGDAESKKVYDSYSEFQQRIHVYTEMTEVNWSLD